MPAHRRGAYAGPTPSSKGCAVRPTLTRRDKLLLWATLPMMVAALFGHVWETARTGLAQLPVFAKWNPGDYPQVGHYRVETDSSGSGLLPGDRLIRIGDRDLQGVGYIGFDAIGLARTTPGHPVPLEFERDGERHVVPLEARPHPQRWARLPILLLIPAVCVLLLLRAPGQPDVQRFYLCFMAYAIGQAQFYGGPEWRTWLAEVVWTIASPAMLFFMLRFVRLFPPEMPESRRVPWLLPWVAMGVYVLVVRANYLLAWPLPLAWVPRVSFALHAGFSALGIGILAWNYFQAWPAGRRRLRWILLGTALGSLPVVLAGIAPLLLPGWQGFRSAFAIGFLFSVIWMMGAVLGTVRDNAFDVDRLIGATAAWSLATGGAVAGLVLAVPVASAGFSHLLDVDPAAARVVLAALLGALVIPVGLRLRPHVDRILFPRRAALQEGAAELALALSRCKTPDDLLEQAALRTAALFDATGMALFVRESDSLVLHRAEGFSPAVRRLEADAVPTRVSPRNAPDALRPDVSLVVPLSSGESIDALLALGPKRRGDIYTTDDAAVLAHLGARVETEWLHFQKRIADRRSQEKTNLLATASHDLRQPLHAMALLGEALQRKLDDPEARELASRIEDATHDLDEMLTGVLDLSKLEAGGFRPEVGDVALADLFAGLERDFSLTAGERGVRLRVVPTRLSVRSDRLLLTRILRNLLSNAVRCVGPGRGVLLGARVRGGRVAVEVRDGGPGIPEARQREIFEAFHQIAGPTAGRLGLGLSIVEGLAGVLGHEVVLRSAPGRGSTFTVYAPRSRATAPSRDASPVPRPAVPLVERVLVVDDDPRVRRASVELLLGWGCDAREAADSGEVARALEDGWRPDFVLADFHLGQETGVEVIAKLRASGGADLRAAIVTAETDPERLAPIREAGLPLLRKPIKPAKLRAVLSAGG